MQYINRRGETYFAFQGTTKTGKPKYFASKKPTSANASQVETLPADFEFFENPVNSSVVIRRHRPTKLTVKERNLLSRLTLEHSPVPCEVVIDGQALIVYSNPMSSYDPRLENMMLGMSGFLAERDQLEPTFKFTLTDEKDRLFSIARYCSRSSMEGWLRLDHRSASLESFAKKYLSHIGQDSYYELC